MIVSYIRPVYVALLTRIQSDLAFLPAVLRVPLAAMLARMVNGMHGHLDWIDAQCSPLTCELERLYDWAAIYGVDRLSSTFAYGHADAVGNAGATLLAGTILKGANDLDYKVVATCVLAVGVNPILIRCSKKGAAGNLTAGQQLTLVDPVLGVNNALTVAALGISGGADDELVNTWRARVVEEWRAVALGGARLGKPDDYRFWARSAHQSITGALVQPHALGMGTVVVRPVCNGLVGRLPTQAVLDAVATYYEQIAPATSDWRVTFPVVHPVTLTIHLTPTVDTAPNRAAIQAAIQALVLTKGDGVLQLLWAEIDIAIAVTTALYALDESGGAPAWAGHEIPVLQPINWI